MKTPIRIIAFIVAVLASQLCLAQAPAGAPAGSTGLCNDGTYYKGETKSGACRGHKGVKAWYGATAATPAKTKAAATAPAPAKTPAAAAAPAPTPAKTPAAAAAPTPAAAPAPAPAAKAKANTATPAPGGGAGRVWLNTETKVYHCGGTRYYGKTKAGAYMTEAEAKAKGAHADHGKACN